MSDELRTVHHVDDDDDDDAVIIVSSTTSSSSSRPQPPEHGGKSSGVGLQEADNDDTLMEKQELGLMLSISNESTHSSTMATDDHDDDQDHDDVEHSNKEKEQHGLENGEPHPLENEQEEEEEEEEPQHHQLQIQRRNCIVRTMTALLLFGLVAFIVVDASTSQYIKTGLQAFLEWLLDHPKEGVIVFSLVTFVTTLLFIPGAILTFGSGYVFSNAFGLGVGVLLGSLSFFVGGSAGSLCSFLLGRFLLRDCCLRLTKKPFLQALDKAMEQKGFRIMLLLRLSPLIYNTPYLNYGAGGMAISFGAYALAQWAILPTTVMMVFLGASASSLADAGSSSSSSNGNNKATTIVLVVGILVSLIAAVLTTIYARQELQKIQQEQQAASDSVIETTEATADQEILEENPTSPEAEAVNTPNNN